MNTLKPIVLGAILMFAAANVSEARHQVDFEVPLRGTLSNHNGGPTFAGRELRKGLITARGQLKSFFSPGGGAVTGPLPIDWAKGQHWTTINWERQMVFAMASEQGGAEVKIQKVMARRLGGSLEYLVLYVTRENTRANRYGSSPFSLAVVDRDPASSYRFMTPAEYAREDFDGHDHGGDTTTEKEIPFEHHHEALEEGPDRNAVEFIEDLPQHRTFFQMQGQRSRGRQIYWTNGERAVAAAYGQGNDRKRVRITRIVQRGNVLRVTVETQKLNWEMSHIYRPYHVVKLNASDLIAGVSVKGVEILGDPFEEGTSQTPGVDEGEDPIGPAMIEIEFEAGPVQTNGGPNRNGVEYIETLQQYKQAFQMQGQQSGARTPFYTGGERVVLVTNGVGDDRKQLTIRRLVWAEGTLKVTVRQDDLPQYMSHINRPYNTAIFNVSELEGNAVKEVVVINEQGTRLTNLETRLLDRSVKGLAGAMGGE